MTQYEKNLSNLSYTNKDFQSIYPELLDLTKKISYKWDPSMSNESDPGVVLLKLLALMTDKLNYNIDKNILELFPLSVTQPDNARQIFEQCGYNMRYYRSANTKVSLSIIKNGEPEITDSSVSKLGLFDKDDANKKVNTRVYSIPMFTMVSSTDNECIYTLVEPVELKSSGEIVDVEALQGTVVQYTISGSTTIAPENLDYNRRLYFTDTDIAENGIFIKSSLYGYSDWVPVDNLFIQKVGTPCYKFGLTDDGSTCYIEFPTDIDELIGDGLEITYIRTKGLTGNIGKKYLTQLYGDVTATRWLEKNTANTTNTEEVVLKSGTNVYVTNAFASSNGKDPETIEEAYRNYQRIRNTFDTLVSLKDYTNYVVTDELVSNGFVCDRTNDIQSSYKIITPSNVDKNTTIMVHTQEETYTDKNGVSYTVDTPEMDAYDLKFYGLRYLTAPNSATGCPASFTPVELYVESDSVSRFPIMFDDVKCVQHNMRELLPNRIVMLKNKYPVKAHIIPQYKLTNVQTGNLLMQVTYALSDVLNSQKVSFGEPIIYDDVYDAIMNSDPRIKAITLDYFDYETYAVYIHEDENGKRTFEEIRIDSNSTQPPMFLIAGKEFDVSETYYVKDAETSEYTQVDISKFLPNTTYYIKNPKSYQVDLWKNFRADIFAKSILAGVTPLFVPSSPFTFSINQKDSVLVEDVSSVSTNADISVVKNKTNIFSGKIKDNENVIFTSPNLIKDLEYSNYTKYFYKINRDIPANTDYCLGDGEWIAFFWKETDDANAGYTYTKFSNELDDADDPTSTGIHIFSTTFAIKKDNQIDKLTEKASKEENVEIQQRYNSLLNTIGNLKDGKSILTQDDPLNETIGALNGSNLCVLTGTNSITTKKLNEVTITEDTNKLYFVLNTTTTNDNKEPVYRLFNKVEEQVVATDVDENAAPKQYIYEYLLQSGEYLFYTNKTRSKIYEKGSGTKITLKTTAPLNHNIDCGVCDLDELYANGISYLDDNSLWYTVGDVAKEVFVATEMEYYQAGPGYEIRFTPRDIVGGVVDKVVLSSDGIKYYANEEQITTYKDGDVDKKISTNDFLINLFDADANSELKLPHRNTDELAWVGRSILNIDCTSKDAQYLLKEHTVKFHDNSGAVLDSVSECCIASSSDIDITGGNNISTSTVDMMTGDYTNPAFLAFKLDEVDKESPVVPSNRAVSIELANKEIVEFRLPVGMYLLKVHTSNTVQDLVLTADNHFTISQIFDANATSKSLSLKTTGNHYILLTVKDDANCSLEISPTLGDGVEKVTITFSPPIGCSITEELTDKLKDDTLTRLQELDAGIFDYTYSVPDDALISNPLTSESFLNSNHIYNPFTICQWTTTEQNDVRVINKVK